MSGGWVEIVERKSEFQSILKLLVEFDERTGRHQRYSDPESHYMRKACAVAPPESLRIFAKQMAEFVFHVVVRLDCASGHEITGWLHEDGIASERAGASPEHPVHRIVCLTDLFSGAVPVSTVDQDSCLRTLLEAAPAA